MEGAAHSFVITNRLADLTALLSTSPQAVNDRDYDLRTPLHVAATVADRLEFVEALVAHKADLNARDRWGRTPLDDANVERFCTLLEEMTRLTDTRFLTITHNPNTMAHQNRLFGVTMAERGVSRLVSVDLQSAERLREAV